MSTNGLGIRLPNPYESRILQVLAFSLRPLTTRQVARFSGISYNTTVIYLRRLNRQRKIKKAVRGNRIYWYL